jgi:ATP sulfurylase
MLPPLFPSGTLVSVPITLSQSHAYHLQTGAFLTDIYKLIPLNMCLAHSIYDWDRHKNDENEFVF